MMQNGLILLPWTVPVYLLRWTRKLVAVDWIHWDMMLMWALLLPGHIIGSNTVSRFCWSRHDCDPTFTHSTLYVCSSTIQNDTIARDESMDSELKNVTIKETSIPIEVP